MTVHFRDPENINDISLNRCIIFFELINKIRAERNLSVIFITHDIGLAYYISDSVYIMEHGKFVEAGKAEDVILNPKAPYTKRLISDVPKIHEPWDLSTVG